MPSFYPPMASNPFYATFPQVPIYPPQMYPPAIDLKRPPPGFPPKPTYSPLTADPRGDIGDGLLTTNPHPSTTGGKVVTPTASYNTKAPPAEPEPSSSITPLLAPQTDKSHDADTLPPCPASSANAPAPYPSSFTSAKPPLPTVGRPIPILQSRGNGKRETETKIVKEDKLNNGSGARTSRSRSRSNKRSAGPSPIPTLINGARRSSLTGNNKTSKETPTKKDEHENFEEKDSSSLTDAFAGVVLHDAEKEIPAKNDVCLEEDIPSCSASDTSPSKISLRNSSKTKKSQPRLTPGKPSTSFYNW